MRAQILPLFRGATNREYPFRATHFIRPALTSFSQSLNLGSRKVVPALPYARHFSGIGIISRRFHGFVNTQHNIAQRSYSSSEIQQPATSFSDPSRPDLFYHLIEPPTPVSSSIPAFAVSFLPTAPSSRDSSTIIGWLPAESESNEEAGLNDFKENPKFIEILHEAIQAGLREGIDEIQINGAIQTHEGWMHIHDYRNVPALNRIGDPDDILASVLVENGKMLLDTYQSMPSYRVCTSDGLTQLTPGLAQKLKVVLETHDRAEKAML